MATGAKPASTRTMASTGIGKYVVCAHNKEKIADDDWTEFVDILKSMSAGAGTPKVGVLVDTPGSGPSARQRAQLNLALEGVDSYIAVMCDSRMVRGAIMAFSWTGIKIKGFPTSDIQGAMDFLDIPGSQRATVESKMAQVLRIVGR